MAVCFIYKKTRQSSMLCLFSSADETAEDYRYLQKKIASFETLFYARSLHFHPFGHKETKEETQARLNFDFTKWLLLAAEADDSDLGFANALIVNREQPRFAYVLELKGFQIVESIHDEWAVEVDEGDVWGMEDALLEFGLTLKTKPVIAPPTPRKEETIRPSFAPNKKKAIPNLDAPIRIEEVEEDEEEGPAAPPVFEAPRFEAYSSKKPRNLDSINPAKPNSFSKQKPAETTQKPKLVAAIETPAFSSPQSKKPINLNQSKSTWGALPRLSLRPDPSMPGSMVLLLDALDEKVVAEFALLERNLTSLRSLSISPTCLFAPSLPAPGEPWRNAVKNFNEADWELIGLGLDAYRRPLSYLLSSREREGFCLILNKDFLVTHIAFNGIDCSKPRLSFEQVLKKAHAQKGNYETAKEEKVLQPIEEPVAEEDEIEEQPSRPALRRVFATKTFLRDEEAFISKYHMQAREDFEQTIRDLLTFTDEELERFLHQKDAKLIRRKGDVAIYKFQFGSSREYVASRLFYCRGYDLKRHMDRTDFLLLGLSDQDEHEDQTTISALLSRMFDGKSDLVLYQKLLPVQEEEGLDQIAYMSSRQFSYLDKARSCMPMAFVGAAGSGKTLLSLRHYIDLGEAGGKVLYLTYQKALCDEVRKKLLELSATHIEAMTYRDLCLSIFGEEVARKMRTKKRFRRWFLEYRDKTGKIQNLLREVGPTPEDQFMICYVFYRGIIDGSRRNWQKRQGKILSKNEFLDDVRDEEGLTAKAKDAIYEVAVAYERHLERRDGTTDNKLAARILSLGKKAKRYDAVVIDEFQDLSEIQFMAVAHLLKPANPLPLFIYGDENQAINPTIFSLSDANTILYEMFGGGVLFHQEELSDSFRCGPNLVHYINDVNAVKRRAIGAKEFEEEKHVSLRDDEEDLFATLVEGKDTLARLVSICAASDKNVVFIFPTVLRKDAASEQFKRLAGAFAETSFLSVEEAKGREWDSVVLVDFFSSEKLLFDQMLGSERVGRHSTVHRMLFNRFYVALTRAANRIVVYESDASPLIREKLLSGLTPLKEVGELASYFEGTSGDAHWLEFGKKLLKARNYAGAYRAFSRVDNDEGQRYAKHAQQYWKAEQGELDPEAIRDLYLENLDLTALKDFYDERGELNRLRFLELAEAKGTDSNYLIEAYMTLQNELNPKERRLFFSLAAKRGMDSITRLLRWL